MQPWYRLTMEPQAVTYRLAQDVYERLRTEAFERHIPQNAIVDEALREHFRMAATGPSESEAGPDA